MSCSSIMAEGWVRDMLFLHARKTPENIVLRYCSKHETEEWNYRQLLSAGYELATEMREKLDVNQRAILLLPGDTRFIASLTACIMCGVSAIPVHLTNTIRIHRSADVIQHILNESQPEYILTLSSLVDDIVGRGWHQGRRLIIVDNIIASSPVSASPLPDEQAVRALYRGGGPVYLQYSSGSTGKPKAVCNYDDNIRAQQSLMLELHCRCLPRVITANWLPFYHDMGMICGLLMPLLSGGCCNFMLPAQMVADPYLWLKMIEEFSANAVAAPDFVWVLCNDMVSDEQISRLDLSSLRVAANAAEPLRADTMARFADRFAVAGFVPQSFTPAYGMAESTLAISYKPTDSDYVLRYFNATALASGVAVPDAAGRALISSGRVAPQWTLRIVDPQTRLPLPEGRVGEVWASGASKAHGYWGNPMLSTETFDAVIADEVAAHRYLRTGDLAFLWQGELFVCGRLKDIIIVAGENYMPNDLEIEIEMRCSGIKTGGVCACQNVDGGELVIMAEAPRHLGDDAYMALTRNVCACIVRAFGLTVSRVVLLSHGRLKKTSSGKIQRSQMLAELLAQRLSPLFVYQPTAPVTASSDEIILSWLHDDMCRMLSVDALDPAQGLADAGLSSLQALRFCQRVNEKFGCRLVVTDLFAHPTLAQLADCVARKCSVKSVPQTEPVSADEVAIVAISCRLPGQHEDDWRTYADWLARGESAVHHEESPYRQFTHPIGALDDIAGFDAAFFAISAKEALLLDPQQRLLLELSWQLFEQAGWRPQQLKERHLGFYIGQSGSEFGTLLLQKNDPEYAKSYLATGISPSASSGRLAKFYGTRGPALTLDTGCSSSLVALDSAVRSLRQGQCTAAVVGGVNLLLSPQIEQALSQAGMLSPRGRCATFSEDADGYARGEGAVMMLLKPHAQARRDGDPVLAVIENSCVAQDGASSSLTAPNPQAQTAMMRQLLDGAGRTADQVSLLETHGTGTALGDPVELSAVDAVYGQRSVALPLGAGKTQTGHLEAASGLFSVLRAVAQLQRQQVFGHPTFSQVNPQLAPQWPRYRYETQTQYCALQRVAVNAFSFTGTMAAVLLRKADEHDDSGQVPPENGMLPLSAHSEAALQRMATSLAQRLTQYPHQAGQILNTWRVAREHHLPVRALVRYHSRETAIAGLTAPESHEVARLNLARQGATPEDWLNGCRFDWAIGASAPAISALARLPVYPFDHQPCWPQGLSERQTSAAESKPANSTGAGIDFVRQWVAATLNMAAAALSEDEDLLALGLDSLQMLDLVDEGKKCGLTLTLAQLFEKTTLAAWESCWRHAQMPADAVNVASPTCVARWQGEPFELTPVQRAYWRGRQTDQILGGVACQIYLELNCPLLSDGVITQAVNLLFQRHDLLRMHINEHGQGVIDDYQPVAPDIHAWAALSPADCALERARLREQLSHRVADLTCESGFRLSISHGRHDTWLHLNIDMVIADGMSVQILLAELSRAILQPQAPWQALDYSFPQYLLEQRQLPASGDSQDYWRQRLADGLAPAPQLPLTSRAAGDESSPRFIHRDWQLDAERWTRLKVIARRQGVTPSMLLAGCYAATLRGWTGSPDFSLNLTIFNRRGEHPDLIRLVADFTTLLLLSCDIQTGESLLDNIRRLNRQFMRDFDHADYSAVQVMRDAAQTYGHQFDMPVVFTSNLGRDLLSGNALGELHYWISQTPQVWIDCQVMEHQGALLLCWDSVDALFPPGMLDQMFAFMCTLIADIADDETHLHAPLARYVAPSTLARRQMPSTGDDIPPFTPRVLHSAFWENVARLPTQCALVDEQGALSYGRLGEQVRELAWRLIADGIQPGAHVGILLPKGRQQVVAVLGCHAAGVVYVPLDIAQPLLRLQQIVAQADISWLIGDETTRPDIDVAWLDINAGGSERITPEQIVGGDPARTAYIIFTSGSTGAPKGVMVSHQAAANTIDDINRRYAGATPVRVLALSALNFDLSVYDIFGPLSCGGALIMPASGQEKDAPQWLDWLHDETVTHWNSVPALFDMLLTAAEYDPRGLPASLRQVLLSGDWVGLDLLPRLRALGCQANFTALGGATEAAIWSNALDVATIDADWRSIPYGYPLAHQYYRVVDSAGRDCPDWVPGELWIGGSGVAQGYYGDREKTADRFVMAGDERFYRSGDIGRFRPDGCLEFLGRQDRQIKLNGHRIELGEIEAQAERFSAVGRAVALYREQPYKHLQLFVEGNTQVSAPPQRDPLLTLPAVLHGEEISGDETALVRDILYRVINGGLGLDLRTWQQPDQLLAQSEIIARYQPLVRHWLAWLTEQDCLEASDQGLKAAAHWRDDASAASHPYLVAIDLALRQRVAWIAAVVSGRENPLELLDDPVLAPETLVAGAPETLAASACLAEKIAMLAQQWQRPVRVAELNGRSGLLASNLLARLPESAVQYCLVESASSLRQQAEYRLSGYPHQWLVRATADHVAFPADVVISNNALHRYADIGDGINALNSLCNAESTVLVLETLTLSPLALLTVLLLPIADGFRDDRQGSLSPLLTENTWRVALAAQAMPVEARCVVQPGAVLLQCRVAGISVVVDSDALLQHLQQRLPAYMLPQHIHTLAALPLNANGKVDRRALTVRADTAASAASGAHGGEIALHGEREKQVAQVWQHVLGVMPNAGSNFFHLGGDSLHATRIVAQLCHQGMGGVTLAQLFSAPVLRDFVRQIPQDAVANTRRVTLIHDAAQRYAPFAPTDVQHAYLTGRQSGFHLGGVATHYYSEYAGDAFDAMRLERALSLLVARHDALRIVFDEQGRQRVLAGQPGPALHIVACEAADWEAVTAAQRAQLSHRVLTPTEWPLFHATLIQCDDGRNRLCLGLDNLVLDGLSMQIFLAELALLYASPEAELPTVNIGFRDYVSAMNLHQDEAAQAYWRQRLESLPEAPRLPLACDPRTIATPRFRRWHAVLPARQWRQLTENARRNQITPSCLLLTCYAQVLARWSESPSLSINVTLFDRQPCHPDINHIMGDFTALLLLACHHHPDESWQQRARRVQQQLGEDLAHSGVSAVWVMRELSRLRGMTPTWMPVVFTSALGAQTTDYPPTPFPPTIWGVSQTPQVWIDHQVFERDGELHFNWDVVEALFPAGMIDDMFGAYCCLLEQLSAMDDWNTPCPVTLPAEQQAARLAVNTVVMAIDDVSMHGRVAAAMQRFATRTALIDGDRHFTYRQLEQAVQTLARSLQEDGVQAGECIGIALPRGYAQVVAALAIQWVGAAYVPLSPRWPLRRRQQVTEQAAIRRVISAPALAWPEAITVLTPDARPRASERPLPAQVAMDTLAYIIFTSGSTGVPKGVAITHAAAVNTLDAINCLYQVTEDDCALALSALHFDLSVWDIFGLLAVGGTLVMVPDNHEKDARHWLTLARCHRVTVWNSVPALLEMALPLCEERDMPQALQTLRLVMLSGDWIAPTLPQRLTHVATQAQVMALGGATEAAVWSNHWPTARPAQDWPSIPYGVPLPNQAFRVVNALNESCPDWVAGELWIGGRGVASGYFGDEARTASQFVEDDGQRWYRTGDIGRYRPGALLEFLGRRDNQVKVSGYRLELDEIRQAICACPSVKDALVWVAHHGGRPALAAAVLAEDIPDWPALAQALDEQLPAYAIPALWGHCTAWPLTDNGKRDQRAIEQLAERVTREAVRRPLTEMEQHLCHLLQSLLDTDDIAIHDNFFALGGDSFIATRLVAALRRQYGIDFPLWQIFRLQTLDRIAEAIASVAGETASIKFEEGTL